MVKKEFYKRTWFWVIIAVVIIGLYAVSAYNNFVYLDQNVEKSWSQVESQYQRQSDLIPNLVSSVSSQVKTETQFVKDVIAARTAYLSASTQLQRDAAGQQMNSGIQNFVSAVAEDYPQLLASEGYTALRDELIGTQNRITTERGRYIESINAYNVAIKRFPSNVFAGMFGYGPKDYYKSTSGTTTPSLGNGTLP